MAAVKIRPWRADERRDPEGFASDLGELVRGANNPDVARWMTDGFPHPYTEADGRAFLASVAADDPVRVFVIEVDGRAAGSIGIFPQGDVHRRNAEMGYWLAEEYWGRGIVPEAIGQIVEYGFATFDIDRIFARPFGSNIRSHRALEKAGFTLEARFCGTIVKDERRDDELWFATRR
jgi:RimJ/RimL family protein N-acetyltransferase